MANEPRTPESPKQAARNGATAAKQDKRSQREAADEVLRDQAKTETEERPYLDTEGGE